MAAAAVGLAGALVLTACSGDGSADADAPATPEPSATATGDSGGGTPDSGASAAPAGELEGSWLTTAEGKAVILMITGGEAAAFTTGGAVCSGTAQEDGGDPSISLECADGTEDRAKGTVDSVDGTTLKVTWEGSLGTETYTKAEGSALPTGLPSAELPTGLPTGLPTAGLGS
ncbi:hypothetical protein HTV45_22580 [Streptomyces sp. CHD11]|uniref:hypothetical protein n=1 Tax=Streptomyces sp. CHD11 TaxID=2741325 RepID=UPI001BFC20D1|nr:hypothetical protein [Streptomyces sp. CHD11]MBT3153617.1 hypothetical protein [Streptomyces sp. CHD11]